MQAGSLMLVYIVIVVILQAINFLVSHFVENQWPGASLIVFLVLFMSAMALGWPIAVRITEWLLRRAGYVVQTEQSGTGAGRADHLRPGRLR